MNPQKPQTVGPNSPPQLSQGLTLAGLDGTNPLGFLAALGLFRILATTSDFPPVCMYWKPHGGTWVPVLTGAGTAALSTTENDVLDYLEKRLEKAIGEHPADLLTELASTGEDKTARRALLKQIAQGNSRTASDWAAAVASDFAPPEAINQLQTTRRDYFFGNLTSVIGLTEREHLRRSVFQPWDYADGLDNQSLHLDPSEDRRHALQWNKPAGDPERRARGGMLGANRLALEAMPLFASFPEAETMRTIGFTGTRSTNTRWTWPIWSQPVSLNVVKSLLNQPLLQVYTLSTLDSTKLKQQGDAAAYRTRRILVGKTPNFTPALCVF